MENMPQSNFEALAETSTSDTTVPTAEIARDVGRLARMYDVLGPELTQQYADEDAAAEAAARQTSNRLRRSRH